MRMALACAVVPLLFCGCAPGMPGAPEEPAPQPDANEVKLPEAPGAGPVVRTDDNVVFINVNFKGQVLLPPVERDGNEATSTLDSAAQIEVFLKRRAEEERRAAAPGMADKPLRTVLLLRVDARTPFEQTYPILKAARVAGFVRYRWRAIRPHDAVEGEIPLPTAKADEKTPKFTSQVTSDDKGKITKITLRGEGIEKELDFKADVGAFAKKLKELAVKHKDRPPALLLEIDERLIQSDVVRLIDAATGAGMTDVSPVPLDPKKR